MDEAAATHSVAERIAIDRAAASAAAARRRAVSVLCVRRGPVRTRARTELGLGLHDGAAQGCRVLCTPRSWLVSTLAY